MVLNLQCNSALPCAEQDGMSIRESAPNKERGEPKLPSFSFAAPFKVRTERGGRTQADAECPTEPGR